MKDKLHLVAFAFQVIGSMRLKSPSHDEYLYIGASCSALEEMGSKRLKAYN